MSRCFLIPERIGDRKPPDDGPCFISEILNHQEYT